MDEQTREHNEPHEPLWIPYSTPPQTRSERVGSAMQRYGFGIALAVTVTFFLGTVVFFLPEVAGISPSIEADLGLFGADSTSQSAPVARSRGEGEPVLGGPFDGEAVVSISSRPMGATVLVGRDAIGVTPLRRVQVPAGAHVLSVRMDGYARSDSVMLFRNDRTSVAYVALDPLPEGAEETDEAAPLPTTRERPALADAASGNTSSSEEPPRSGNASSAASSQAPPAASEPAPQEPRAEEGTGQQARAAAESASSGVPTAGTETGGAASGGAPAAPDSMFFEDESLRRLYRAHMDRGNDLFVEEAYEDARDAYERALAVRPDDAKAVFRIKKINGILEESARNSERYAYQRAQGDLLFEQEDYAEAVERFENALQFKPGDPYATRRLAASRERAERARSANQAAAAARETATAAARRTTVGQGGDGQSEAAQQGGASSQDGPVRMNLNTATAAQLERLPGIGPTLAQRILDYRTSRGAFRSVRELESVRGIGPKTMEEIAPLVFVQR